MRGYVVGAGLALWAGVGLAHPLDGAAIAEALTDKTLRYQNGAIQTFYASGRTLYDAGQPSWGYWRVQGDLYCSQWPPSGQWDCYAVKALETGVRFVDTIGHATDGVYETS